jgi:hypothetical protein
MFQFEVREVVAILLNVLTAVVVIVAAVAVLNLNTKVGTVQTDRYIAEERLHTRYQYSACDTKIVTYDELRAYFADYIKDGLTIYIALDTNKNSKLDASETYYAWDINDYNANKSAFDVDNLKLSIPTPSRQRYSSSVSTPPTDLIIQEVGSNVNVRYIAKVIYDDNDPVKQEKGTAYVSRSIAVTGILFLKSDTTGVTNLYS